MMKRLLRCSGLPALVLFALSVVVTQAEQTRAPAALRVDAPAQSAIPIDGEWKFRTGDDPAWASPSIDDSGWQEIEASRPWGEQGHPSYAGFAWYRKRLSISAGDVPVSLALLVPYVDSAYEVYWNGVLLGRDGKLPPYPVYYLTTAPPRIFPFPDAGDGVLAFRVWKAPLLSDDSGRDGGFSEVPFIGSNEAIQTRLALRNYRWLRSEQFYFGLNVVYGLVALLSLLAWFQDRRQWVLFWMFGFALAPLVEMLFYGLRLRTESPVVNALWQPITSLRDICLWCLLLWLLQLRHNRRLVQLVRIAAWVSLSAEILDAAPYLLGWIPALQTSMQIADAVLTACWIPTGAVSMVLVGAALLGRQRRDFARWAVAVLAAATGVIQVARTLATQGLRFTHWTLADKLEAPLFTVEGNAIFLPSLAGTLLLIATVYAVYRTLNENRNRQSLLEQEFKSARELQRVLIPESLPTVAGFTLTSAYLPAQQVGGDFFQIIPLESTSMNGLGAGAAFVIVGDVSGKGLKAAMAVSFIVGVLRALANLIPSPAHLLSELNQRLASRMQGGFSTCIVLRVEPDGRCVIASAGHPAVFLNSEELDLPGAFPLGLLSTVSYDETTIQLQPGDRCTLYTDGLLEARSPGGELYGFERLRHLLQGRPDAEAAVAAAVRFGQDDDITVVTLTRTSAPSNAVAGTVSR